MLVKTEMDKKQRANKQARAIESADRRLIHFMFNPGNTIKESPFTRKLKKFVDGTLQDFEAKERTKFEEYLEAFVDDTLEEDQENPVVYANNDFFELNVSALKKISFGVADNPFFKATVAKYYPECHVINKDGVVLASYVPKRRIFKKKFPNSKYMEGFRDERLKINDDRKICFNLEDFEETGVCIVMTIRSFDNSKEQVKEDAFAQALARLNNEETNQSIDYTFLEKIEKPEGFEEAAAAEEGEEEDDTKPRNELVYICGRLHRAEEEPQAPLETEESVQEKEVRTGLQACTRCDGKKHLTGAEWDAKGFKGMKDSDCAICDEKGQIACTKCDGKLKMQVEEVNAKGAKEMVEADCTACLIVE